MPTAFFFLDHFWGERSGGAEWQTFLLCRALREKGWEVHYVAENLTGKTGRTEETHGIRVHWLPLQWRSRLHPSQRRLFHSIRAIVDQVKPDVLYTRGNNCFTGIGVTHRIKHATRVRTVWGAAADWEISRNFYRERLRYYPKALWRKSLLWVDACIKDTDHASEIAEADCIVVQSEQQRALVRERFRRDAQVLASSHEIPPEPTRKASPPSAIFVAHIGRRKRVELFVDLARRCQNLPVRFVVVGDFSDPAHETEVRSSARDVKNIEFSGPLSIEETNRRIAEATLLVSTTDPGREGYPNVFIQAWMRNTPVLSLAHDPDGVLRHNSFLGECTGTMDALIADTRRLLVDPNLTEKMGRDARKWAIDRHSYSANAGRIQSIFQSLLQRTS